MMVQTRCFSEMSVPVHFHETSRYGISEDSILHVDQVFKGAFQQFSVASGKMVTFGSNLGLGTDILKPLVPEFSFKFQHILYLKCSIWRLAGRYGHYRGR
jgi:hypothetical protein